MLKEKIVLNKKEYTICLTRHAKKEIEELENENRKKLIQDDATIDALASVGELNEIKEEMEYLQSLDPEENEGIEERISALTSRLSVIMTKVNLAQLDGANDLDPYNILYILLKNYRKNPPLSKKQYEDGMDDLEEEMGLEELERFVNEVTEKVFTEMEMLQKMKEHLSKNEEKQMN